MPISLTSYLTPKNGAKWFLLEDIYLRGGFRVVATVAERDTLHASTKKVGMLVAVLEDGKIWKLTASSTWEEFKQAVSNSYTHVQQVAAPVWEIVHGRNCEFFTYNVFDEQKHMVFPNEIHIVDSNTIQIEFAMPMSGHCTFSFDLNTVV